MDLTGQKIGKLTVIGPAEPRRGRFHWVCSCECGTEREVAHTNLRQGHTLSCGCLRKENWLPRRGHDGSTKHPLYTAWNGMTSRCHLDSNKSHANYGGRGISVYSEWRDDRFAFYAWVEENLGSRPEGKSLDRIDNDGNYEPGNLRWATRREQRANQRPQVTNAEYAEALARIAELEAVLDAYAAAHAE